MTQTRDSRTLAIAVAAAIAVVTWIAYAHVGDFDFVGWDDDDYVRKNRNVLAGLTGAGVRWAWTSGEASNWHPLTWMSHMLDAQLYGLEAGGHHLTSLALHVVCALLLFGAVRTACGSLGAAALTSALFALHPLHVESVAWVSERKDVLSTAFGFGALWAYAAYARRGGARRYALVVAGLAASLCSKATFVTLPFVLLLLDVWPLGRLRGGPRPAHADPEDDDDPERGLPFGRLVLEKLPLLGLALASSLVTYLVQQASGATRTSDVIPLGGRLANALVSYTAYLGKTFVPRGLAMFYPHPSLGPRGGWDTTTVLGSALLIVAITAAAWFLRRRRPWWLVGWLWYLGTLVPVIGLVQVGTQAMADRYTYLPLVGVFLALAWALVQLQRARPAWKTALVAASTLLCLGCAALTRRQADTWRSSETLARHALAVTEGNWAAHAVLADWLQAQKRMDEALEHYTRVLEVGSPAPAVLSNRGSLLFDLGRTEEAIESLELALQLDSSFAPAHNNLGKVLSQAERFEEAERHYDEALRVDPQFTDAHNNLGVDLARQGRFDEALPHLQAVLRLGPTPLQAFNVNVNLGVLYMTRMQSDLGRGDEKSAQANRRQAAEHFTTAGHIDPASALPGQLLQQLGYGT